MDGSAPDADGQDVELKRTHDGRHVDGLAGRLSGRHNTERRSGRASGCGCDRSDGCGCDGVCEGRLGLVEGHILAEESEGEGW